MQRALALASKLSAAHQLQHVVRVTAVGEAAPRRHQTAVAQLTQVIRDEALTLPSQLAQLTDTPIAARELAQQPPAQRMARKPQKRRRAVCLDSAHHNPRRRLHQAGLMRLPRVFTAPDADAVVSIAAGRAWNSLRTRPTKCSTGPGGSTGAGRLAPAVLDLGPAIRPRLERRLRIRLPAADRIANGGDSQATLMDCHRLNGAGTL